MFTAERRHLRKPLMQRGALAGKRPGAHRLLRLQRRGRRQRPRRTSSSSRTPRTPRPSRSFRRSPTTSARPRTKAHAARGQLDPAGRPRRSGPAARHPGRTARRCSPPAATRPRAPSSGRRGYLLDFDKELTELGVRDKVAEGAVSTIEKLYGGAFNFLPFQYNIEGIFYNKAIFEENGWDVPETWDDLVDRRRRGQGRRPDAASRHPASRAGRSPASSAATSSARSAPTPSRRSRDGDAKLTDPEYVAAAQAIADLGAAGYFGDNVASLDYDAATNEFLTGKAAMIYMGSWLLGNINGDGNTIGADNVGFFTFPAVDGGAGSIDEYPSNVGLPATFGAKTYTAGVGDWLKCITANYGNEALKQGQITGFIADDAGSTCRRSRRPIADEIADATDSVLWFEALFNAKASSISSTNAALLVTGQLSRRGLHEASSRTRSTKADPARRPGAAGPQVRRGATPCDLRSAHRPRSYPKGRPHEVRPRRPQSDHAPARRRPCWSTPSSSSCPSLWSFGLTFFTGSALEGFEFNGLANFQRLFTDPYVWDAFWFTVKYALLITLFQVVLGYGLALLYHVRAAQVVGRSCARSSSSPSCCPPSRSRCCTRSSSSRPRSTASSTSCSSTSASPSVDWLGSGTTAFVVIVIMDVWRSVGFYGVLLFSGLLDIPDDIIESARIDGAEVVQALPAHHPADVAADPVRLVHLQHQRHDQGVRLGLRPHRRRPGQLDHAADAVHVPHGVPVQRLRVRLDDRPRC